jgi:NAD(P)-dependent dehydrogenase (short-subunit alcohol dehydrogenase family)
MKVAIVTGASRGIGKCVAKGLAQDGYSLSLIARNQHDLASVAAEIASAVGSAPPVMTHPLDVSDNEAVQRLIDAIHLQWGRIDLLFNNAGISYLGTLTAPLDDFDRVLSVNLRGAFSILKAVVPIMKTQGSGTIFNVASRAGKIGFAEYGVYGASKFGLVGLSESLYHELSPLGIKVTALCPSWVNTDMAKMSDLPPEEMISPEDILATVRYVLNLSPAAAIKEIGIECRNAMA